MTGNGGKRSRDLSEDTTIRHHLFDFLRIVLREGQDSRLAVFMPGTPVQKRLKGFSTFYRRATFSQAHQGNFSHHTATKRLEPDAKGINKTCKDTENMMF